MSFSGDSAERIDAACRLAGEGKLAARRIAAWLAGAPVNEPEFRLLWLLAGGLQPKAVTMPLDQADLAEQLVVSPAQVSGAVERLRSLGLLERMQHERDRRRQLWQVTNAGDELLRRIVNQVAGVSSNREAAA
jgi:DNA-binding MarR family transcriptional regulator